MTDVDFLSPSTDDPSKVGVAEAMEQKIDYGIWGGLSVRERRELRKRLAG